MSKQPAVPKSGLSNIVAEWLWGRLQEWTEQGIITPDQKTRIQDLYLWPPHVSRPQTPSKPVNLILALEIIGAILVGAGLITFIASNWPQLANAVKLALLIGLIAGIHISAGYLTAYTGYPGAGRALSFLGNLAYGAGIWLVAQMYHLPPSFPQGMLIWALGVLPMAFVFKSRLNYFLAVGLFIAWTLGQSVGYQTPQPVFLAVLLGLLVPMAYYLGSRAGLAVCLATGGLWLYLNLYLWADLRISAYLLVPVSLYGLLLLALSNLHAGPERMRRYRTIYLALGGVILGTVIFSQPLYGVWAATQTALSPAVLPWPYWLSAGLLLAAGGAIVLAPGWRAGDETGREVRMLFPFLAGASLYWLALPLIKFSVLPSWLGTGTALVGLWLVRRIRGLWYAAMIYGLVWLAALFHIWREPVWILGLLMLAGAGIYMYGWLPRERDTREEGMVFNLLGLVLALAPMFFMTFHAINRELYHALVPVPKSADFWILAGLLAAGWLVCRWRTLSYAHPRKPGGLLPEEEALAAGLAVAPFALGAAACTLALSNWFTFTLNAALMLLAVMFLITGYRRREAYLKAFGFALISLLVACRFFEMDWSLLYKSLLLVSTGIVIMTVGILFEKNKEKVAVID